LECLDVEVDRAVACARLVTLEEKDIGALPVEGNRIGIRVPAGRIGSVALTFDEGKRK